MVSTAGAGGTVINFSDRFSLSGMTGTFPPTLEADLKNVKDTKGPPSVNQVAGAKGAAGGAEGDFAVPYTMQTGAQRFAPMQPPAPTKITAKDAKPLWPVSASTVATTWLPPPTIATTITQSPNHSVKSRVNTAAPAAQPSDDMAKFLARWKD
ncbi:MAG: hypothetical protein M1832_000232 [Thelocarpon impressellum]|nr:MAG: hypothetical protein M1832_000232 [Thelocarpon impressellum]